MISYYHKLIYFLPLGLITGPFLPDLIVIICTILFLIDTFRFKLFSYYNNRFFKLFLLFLLFINLSSFFSESVISFKYSAGYLRFGVFAIFVFYVLKNFKNSKIFIGYSIILTYLILILDGYIQYIFGKNILLYEIQMYNEYSRYVTSFFNDEKKLGSFLSKMFPLLLISFIFINEKYNNSKYNFYFSIVILFTFFLIFLTTERVSIFIIIFLIFVIFFKSNFFLKPKFLYLIFIPCLLLILFYFNPNIMKKIWSIFYSTGIIFPGYSSFGKVLGEYDIGLFIYSKFHHDQIMTCINLFKENSLFGIGAKNFKNTLLGGWHPHNYHAQILAETGIFSYLVFLLLFIFLCSSLIKNFFKKKKLINEKNIYLLSIFFLNIFPIPSGDFFNNWVNIIIFFPVGYYLYINEK